MPRAFFLCALVVYAVLTAVAGDIPEFVIPVKSDLMERRSAGAEARGVRVIRSRSVALRSSLIDSATPAISITPFDGLTFAVVRNDWQATADGKTGVWTGRLTGDVSGMAILAATDGVVYGSIYTEAGDFYEIRPGDENGYEVRQVEYDERTAPDDAVPIHVPLKPQAQSASQPATSNTVVDVLFVYTAAARQTAGGTSAIQSKIALAVTEINQSYLNSGIPMELRLVRTAEVSYDESAGIDTALSRLTSGTDGFMDEVQTLRNQTGADLVQLWINGPGSQGGTVGLAWIMGTPSSYYEPYGYSVVEVNFATGPYYSSGHEFGHNQGAAHDRANASVAGAYSYAYGYQKANVAYPFRTIMSYACAGVYCPKLNYWSNPDLSYQGQPIGVASTSASAADNRLALTNTRTIVAGFRGSAQQPPVPSSVSPISGSGSSATFTAVYQDANGATDIAGAYLLVHSQVRADLGCFLYYNRAANTIQLLNDNATSWGSAATAGTNATLANSQCRVSATGVQAAASGESLQVVFPLAFTTAFSGAKNVYLLAIDAAGANSNWYLKGTWTVTAAQAAPRPVSVTPSSGTGTAATFTGIYNDDNGATDIAGAYYLIHSQVRADAGCFIFYSRTANTLQLLNDAGTFWSAAVAAGSTNTLSNSQCSITASGASASASGNQLSVTIPVTFRGSFTGTKNVYLLAIDSAGANSNWSKLGTWTIPVSQQPPVPSSVSPAAASGSTVTLSGLFTDANGATDITGAYFLIHSQVRADAGCFVYYNRAANTLQLLADSGWPWSNAITPGSGSVANSRCTINGASSSVSASGNNLTVNLSLTAKPAFSGVQTVYLLAIDSAGANSNWFQKGTWTTGY